MNEAKVHRIVTGWMREVMRQHGWSAGHWAALAQTPATNITRVVNGPEPIIPNLLTIAKLAAVAGSQPDLLRTRRAVAHPEPVRRARSRVDCALRA